MDEPLLCCRNCGAPLPDLDPAKEFVTCPHCGGVNLVADLLADSDPVRIEKIRARARTHMEDMRLREETDRLLKMRKDNSRCDEKSRNQAKAALVTTGLCLAGLTFAYISWNGFQQGAWISGSLAGLQSLLSLGAVLFRIRQKQLISLLLALLCGLLIFPWRFLSQKEANRSMAFSWQELTLSQSLPEPRRCQGQIRENREDHLSLLLMGQSERDYERYAQDCREEGFFLETGTQPYSLAGDNAEGDRLTLSYREEPDMTQVELWAPIALEKLQWPEDPLGSLIPRPASGTGKLLWSYPDNFSLQVGDTAPEAFRDYAQTLSDLGYDQDQTWTDSYFSTRNPDGVQVDLTYESGMRMSVYLRLP